MAANSRFLGMGGSEGKRLGRRDVPKNRERRYPRHRIVWQVVVTRHKKPCAEPARGESESLTEKNAAGMLSRLTRRLPLSYYVVREKTTAVGISSKIFLENPFHYSRRGLTACGETAKGLTKKWDRLYLPRQNRLGEGRARASRKACSSLDIATHTHTRTHT